MSKSSNVAAQYSVYIGTSKKNGEKVTLKEYLLYNGNSKMDNQIVHEVVILCRLSKYPGFPVLKELFVVEGQSLFIVSN
jgi:hypothetical protein